MINDEKKLLLKKYNNKKKIRNRYINKPNKRSKNKNNLIVIFLFFLVGLTYFYPIVKYSKNKLDCENNAKKYIKDNKNLTNINKKKLKMLSTNFCNGGEEIYEIENLRYFKNH